LEEIDATLEFDEKKLLLQAWPKQKERPEWREALHAARSNVIYVIDVDEGTEFFRALCSVVPRVWAFSVFFREKKMLPFYHFDGIQWKQARTFSPFTPVIWIPILNPPAPNSGQKTITLHYGLTPNLLSQQWIARVIAAPLP
jgi:hypothetical protein